MDEAQAFEEARSRVLARESEKIRLQDPEWLFDAQNQTEIDFSDWSSARLYDTLAQVAVEIGRREKTGPLEVFTAAALGAHSAILELQTELEKVKAEPNAA